MDGLLKKVAANTGVQVLGKAVSVAIGVLITILLTRYLGPSGYGTYSYVIVLVTLFGSFSDWGLNLITIREASKSESGQETILGTVLTTRLALSLVAFGLVNLIFRDPLVFIASFFLIAISLKTSFQIIFNVRLKMHFWALSELAANCLLLSLVLVIIYFKADLPFLMGAVCLGQFFAAVVAGILAVKQVKFKWGGITLAKKLVVESLPMGAILLLFTVYNRIDTVVLYHFMGSSAVGYYSVAYKVYEVLVQGAAFTANSFLPVLSKLATDNRAEMSKVYWRAFAILLVGGIFVGAMNLIFAPWFVALSGEDFSPAVGPLRILSLALLVSYFNHLNGYSLIALGKQKYSLYIALVTLTVNVVLNMLLIPLISYYGAAIVTVLTEALVAVFSVMVIRRELGLSGSQKNLKEGFVWVYLETKKILWSK